MSLRPVSWAGTPRLRSVHHRLRGRVPADDRVVHVLEIVIDGSVLRSQTTCQRDAVRIEIVQIHLAVGILVQAYRVTAGRFLQRKKYGSLDEMFSRQYFVEREIEVRISGVVNQVFHDENYWYLMYCLYFRIVG